LAIGVTAPRAQTNIDQGKTPAEVFNNTCATCHKSPRGLANGQNSLTLTSFLREHYTASRDQASSLAAYVLSNGGNAPAAANAKPGRAANAEEPKPTGRTRAPSAAEESAPASPPAAAAVRRETRPPVRNGKTEPPAEQASPAEPSETPAPVASAPSSAAPAEEARPPAPQPSTPMVPSASEKPAEPTPQAPVASTSGSGSANGNVPGASAPGLTTPSAAPDDQAEPGDGTPVPRDNIPD
jgi:hypothetical protein